MFSLFLSPAEPETGHHVFTCVIVCICLLALYLKNGTLFQQDIAHGISLVQYLFINFEKILIQEGRTMAAILKNL